MRTAVTVACIQAEPVILDRDATIEKLARLAAEAARNGAQLLVFPEAFIPAYPSSVWARALAGWAEPGAKEAFAMLARESLEIPGEATDRLGEIARENQGPLVNRRPPHRPQPPRAPPRAARDALQPAPLPRSRRHARAQAPQARPDEPRATRLGPGRRRGPARDPDGPRPARRPDLLGELHATRAFRALRVGRRDLRRLDRR